MTYDAVTLACLDIGLTVIGILTLKIGIDKANLHEQIVGSMVIGMGISIGILHVIPLFL